MEGRHALIRLVITQKKGGSLYILRSWPLSDIKQIALEAHPSDGHPDCARTGRIKIVGCGRLGSSGLIENQCGGCTETLRIPIQYRYESIKGALKS